MRSFAAVLPLAFAVVTLFSDCSPTTPACGPTTCATGCCDANGTCQPGNTAFECGVGGQICDKCVGAQTCSLGRCAFPQMNLGGGTQSSGCGSATGGGSAVGGGSANGSGTGSLCAGSLTNCQGSCKDTAADVANCGSCGSAALNRSVVNALRPAAGT
jgi:hypothetical protein